MSENIKWVHEQRCRRTVKSLQKNGFEAVFCEDKQAAADYIVSEARNADSIGFGGSATINELQVEALLSQMGKEILQHNIPGLSPDEKLSIRRRQLTCDLFLTGTNAVTMTGELVNVDGAGNRVGAMTFGPEKVIVVVGRNKITDDTESALKRIKDYAAPMNARRLGKNTPCAVTGVCADCNSDDRICRITVILGRKPLSSDIRVLVVNDDMGY
jgi:L-lactate utilization protein LutB